jgi:hypothetical protein
MPSLDSQDQLATSRPMTSPSHDLPSPRQGGSHDHHGLDSTRQRGRAPRALLALASAAALMGVLRASSQGPAPACPGRSARQVDALISESTLVHECDGGIELAWIHLSWDGTQCPDWQVARPAHQTCLQGPQLPGHRCVSAGILPVERRTCQCDEATVLGGLVGILNKCSCTEWLPAGHVEDHETQPCPGT